MEILYVVGMIAVFVLCLALFSTARRILRSSALSNGQFGASRMYDVESPEDETSEELSSTKMDTPALKAIFGRSNVAKNDFALMDDFDVIEAPKAESPMAESAIARTAMIEPVMAESVVPEVVSPETITAATTWTTAIVEEESVMAAYVPPAIPSWAEKLADEDDFEQPQTNNWTRFRNPSRQKYNYALECLLLGVSAWVLLRTQRGTLRYRLSQTASDRVA